MNTEQKWSKVGAEWGQISNIWTGYLNFHPASCVKQSIKRKDCPKQLYIHAQCFPHPPNIDISCLGLGLVKVPKNSCYVLQY